MNLSLSLPIIVAEHSHIRRINEPITVGIPLPRGTVFDPSQLVLFTQQKRLIPLQVQPLARWFDDSIQWALLDFEASVEPGGTSEYRLQLVDSPITPICQPRLAVQRSADTFVVDTGQATFYLNTHTFKPFDRVVAKGGDALEKMGSNVVLTDANGRAYTPKITSFAAEVEGPIRLTLKIQGVFSLLRSAFANFTARLNFYANRSLVEVKFTLHNPKAAHHPGGLWDLGDPGSIYFSDLALHVYIESPTALTAEWTTQPHQPVVRSSYAELEIYQDSSGGPNWNSSNHLNRFVKVMNTRQGYRVVADGAIIQQGRRATPVVSVRNEEKSIVGAIEDFWQNFPKAIEVHDNRLSLGLFPRQYADVYELQGGEQKTHTLFLQFSGDREPSAELGWVHDRLIARTTPECYARSKAISYLTPRNQEKNIECLQLIDTAVTGTNTFLDRREIVDEYGWRHFGDLYADHEAVGHKGDTPLIAHYNNQYDAIFGALIQYLRGGDGRWFQLMDELAKHVIDVDIYHTQEDRPAYNDGLFWHTDHYTDAATATHRSYSLATLRRKGLRSYGGGPSNEHNYTTGLLYYYYLTGNPAARQAVQELADWVINMDDGSRGALGLLDRRPTGLASATVSLDYHGPGRGSGNSINALIDAFLLTRERLYLSKAEGLIRRCIHPREAIQKRGLEDVEHRWSYTIFLQSLGKYLDVKAEINELDYMYSYARESLLHYAKWMVEHEVSYKCVLDRVEIPTETWPAQDIRKSNVFEFAAKHADDPLRKAFLRKADFFFDGCIRDLLSFESCTLTRPVVLLMANSYMHAYFQMQPDEAAPRPSKAYNFGSPQKFTPQLYEFYKTRTKLTAIWHTMKDTTWRLRQRFHDRQRRVEGRHG